jgi:hypothetical protein
LYEIGKDSILPLVLQLGHCAAAILAISKLTNALIAPKAELTYQELLLYYSMF